MATPDLYRFSLDDGTGPVLLRNAPEDWMDNEVKVVRNRAWHGLLREYAPAYNFVKDGARILAEVYYPNGSEGYCKLKVERRRSSDLLYEDFVQGALEMAKSTDNLISFSVPMKDEGPADLVKSKEDTIYEIAIDGPAVLEVDVPGMLLQGTGRWVTAWPPPITPGPFGFDPSSPVYVVNVSEDQVFTGITPNAATQGGPGFQLFTAQQNLSGVYFKGTLNYFLDSDNVTKSFTLTIQKTNGSTSTVLYTLDSGTIGPNSHVDRSVTFDTSATPITLLSGEKISYLIDVPTATAANMNVQWEEGHSMRVYYLFKTPSISFRGMRVVDVFKKLITKITASAYLGQSDFMSNAMTPYVVGLDNIPFDTILTSGDAIRGLTTSGRAAPVIKISLSQLFKATQVWWSTGMSIENNVVRIEHIGRYYDKANVIADLGTAATFKRDHAQDMLYNKLSIGYDPQDYDNVNGREEFNTTQLRSFPVSFNNELNMISPIRADGYGVFYAWVKNRISSTVDNTEDSSVFAVEIEHTPQVTGHYKALHLAGTRSGMLDPDNTINYGLSPLRCLLRNGALLRSYLYGLDGQKIEFRSTSKNAGMQSDLGNGLIVENSDVLIGSLADSLFQPMVFTIEVSSPENLLALMNIYPYGVFRFNYQGVTLDGFPLTVGLKPANPEAYTFTLLSSPNNDLSKLIRR